MRQNDRRKRLFKTFTACLLAVAMLLSNVMGAVEVWAEDIVVKEPTVNDVLYDATTISGANLAKAKVKVNGKNKTVIATVHVILKGEGGTVKATLSDSPTSGTTWKVDLPEGVKVAKGDKVTVYQQIGEVKSQEVTKDAQPSKASTVTLTMPTGEFWVEEYVANVLNDDEKAEAIDLLKKVNPDIANDISSVDFVIEGIDSKTASYTVTYKDKSKTEKIPAPGLTIKKVTETSRSPEIDSITIVDNVVKGKLPGPGPFDGIKVQLVIKVNKDKAGQYCDENKCTVDKDSSNPVGVTLQNDGTFSYNLQTWDHLELDQIVGVSVKEPHKFVSCSTTIVKPVKVEKKEVKDPRKLTSEDKKAIDAAIRKAYIVDGVSKLPNGTGDWEEVPAIIQIDDSGNVKIFSGNDAAGKWDSEGTFVPETNADGSVKLNKGAQPKIIIQGKDLLKNIKPDAPTVALSGDKKNITITPNEKDTDAKIITVSYKDKDNKDQTTTATKADDGTWSIVGEGTVVDGVISLPKNNVKGDTDVTATVTDKGGVADDDKTPLTSDPGTLKVEETIAEKVEALGGLDPVDLKKWVGDEVDWKKGVKAKDSATDKDKINEYLNGATVTDASEPKTRTTEKSGDFEGKVKVTFSDGSEIVVEKQMLYVSDLVSPSDKENLPEDAIDVQLKLGEGVKAGDKEGSKETPVIAKTYKVKPETDLSKEKVSKTEKTCFDDVGATVSDDTYVDVTWNDKDKGTNFKATTENNVFTATATKKFKVTVQANGGTGDDKVETKKSGEKYTLPKGDTFTPPENKEFAGWLVGDTTTTTDPGTEITITGDTVIKASWKPIMVDVSFDKGEGSGSKEKVFVAKGSEYTLPNGDGFTAPKNQEFAGWEVNGETKNVGDKITVNENTTVTAKYKPIMVDVSFDKGEGSGNKDKVSVAKGSEYTLPDSEGFTAPENKEFDGWTVNGEDKKVGDEITVNENTTVTAKWKEKAPVIEEFKVKFIANGGTGSMKDLTVKKGASFKLPPNKFTAPEGKEFDGWDVNGRKFTVGTEVTVSGDGNMKVKALWKDKGTPGKQDPSQPGKPDGGTFYMGSTLIMPNRATEPVKPAKEMEIGRHIRYLYGYEDRTVRPQGKITRAEAAALIARLAELDMSDKSKPDFVDTPSAWYNSAINIMVKKDLMFGDKNGNFRPSEPITRGEFARALLYIDAKNDKVAPFADVKGHQFEAAINQAFGNGRINGYPDGTFRPDDYIQRAEAARMLNQYANRGTTLEGMAPVAKDLARFTDINESHWAYCEIMEAANSHEYQRVKGTQAETWLKILYDDMKK